MRCRFCNLDLGHLIIRAGHDAAVVHEATHMLDVSLKTIDRLRAVAAALCQTICDGDLAAIKVANAVVMQLLDELEEKPDA